MADSDKVRKILKNRCVRSVAIIAVAFTMAVLPASNKVLADSSPSGKLLVMEEINSNRYTQPYYAQPVENRLTLDGYEKIMSNSLLDVYLKRDIGGLRVVDRQTGYIWGGTKEDNIPELNNTWDAIANSILYMEYYDDKSLPKNIGIGNSSVEKQYKQTDNALSVSVSFNELDIVFSFTVELNDNGLTFRMDDSSIQENGKYRLGCLYFFPFLGATLSDEIMGYTFVPDGCGALIRFSKPARFLVAFDKRVYGGDYAIDSLTTLNDLNSRRPNDFATPEQTVLMPVFGMVHGSSQAYYSVIGNGSEYSAIAAYPSGVVTDFNRAAVRFIYRQLYLQPVTRKGEGVQMLQKERNTINPAQTFYFLNGEDSSYVGIAKEYRQYLSEAGSLNTSSTSTDTDTDIDIDTDIGISLEVLCADIKNGFLFNTTKKITSLSFIRDSVMNLIEEGAVKNVNLTLLGWQKGGLNAYKKTQVFNKTNLGSNNELLKLQSELNANGSSLKLQLDPSTAKQPQIDVNANVGITLSQALIKITRDNPLVWLKDTYYIKPQVSQDILEKQTKALINAGFYGFSIDGYSRFLYAENLQDKEINRVEVREMQEQTIYGILSNSVELSMYTPNQYLWKYTGEMLNTPVVNSQFLFETDTVPFLQIVLSGTTDMYAPYSNLSMYTPMDILKHIDYGVYPSFLLTEAENHELEKTGSSDLYSTCFNDWKEQIKSTYQTVNEVLKHVIGQTIESRDIPKKGISITGYSNGGTVIVNYTGESYLYRGIEVSALSAVFIDKEGRAK